MKLNCPFLAGDHESKFQGATECYQEGCALWDYTLNQCCFKSLVSNVKNIVSIKDIISTNTYKKWQKELIIMAKGYVVCRFFCLNCGHEGIPLPRKISKQKKSFHRKK